MGMNPTRTYGGNSAVKLTQRGLISLADAYGVAPAAMSPLGIVQGAAGARPSSFGAKSVSAVPPTLRNATTSTSTGVAQLPLVGGLFAKIPGGSAIQLLVFGVVAYLALRFVIRESV